MKNSSKDDNSPTGYSFFAKQIQMHQLPMTTDEEYQWSTTMIHISYQTRYDNNCHKRLLLNTIFVMTSVPNTTMIQEAIQW